MQTLRHVVSGTDFSDAADDALDMAIRLAAAARVGLTVVHVCELGEGDHDEQRLRQCEQVLTELVARHQGSGVEISAVLRSGKPWEKLDNVAAEVGASLIVIGRQGAGRGLSVELGSVAERLVRSASRSVLTVASSFDRGTNRL